MADAYILDTSVATIAWDGLNPRHTIVRERLAALDDGAAFLSVCAVSLGETLYGLEIHTGTDVARSEAIRAAMAAYFIYQIDQHTMPYYAKLRGELFQRHAPRDSHNRVKAKRPEALIDQTTSRELGIQENDLWIISVAVQYDLHLITRDDKMQRILDVASDTYSYTRFTIWNIPIPSTPTP